jgi:exonuclease III
MLQYTVWVGVGGDFNTHISELDKSTFSCTRPFTQSESAKELLAVANKFELEDLWRPCKGDERGYTRYQPSVSCFFRIDYFFTAKDLRQFLSEIRIKQAPFSDHSILLSEIAMLGTKSTYRSPSWKFLMLPGRRLRLKDEKFFVYFLKR